MLYSGRCITMNEAVNALVQQAEKIEIDLSGNESCALIKRRLVNAGASMHREAAAATMRSYK